MFVVFGLMTLVLIFTACGGKAASEHTEPVPTATFAPTPTITAIQFGSPDSDFAGGAIDGAGNAYSTEIEEDHATVVTAYVAGNLYVLGLTWGATDGQVSKEAPEPTEPVPTVTFI